MNPIIYFDGKVADRVGLIGLHDVGQAIADYSKLTVDILTHGDSVHHAQKRLTFTPGKARDGNPN